MNKTKLGVSTNLMAAFIYALAIVISFVSSGMAFTLALVVTVAYILYKEEDMWLKSSAVKAVAIVLVFMLVPFLFGFVYDIMDFLNFFFQFADFRLYDKFAIIPFITTIIDVLEKLFLLLLAVKALKGQTVKVPVVDDMVAKHLQ
jgi:uncharacterized membrane protein